MVLLRAIRLLSLGIPFYLLDTLADTVAYAVHDLATKAHILTTEPYRVLLAGQVRASTALIRHPHVSHLRTRLRSCAGSRWTRVSSTRPARSRPST